MPSCCKHPSRSLTGHILYCFFPFIRPAALADTNNVVVEEHPLVVTYESVAGGAIKKGQEDHLRNQTELVLLVHRSGAADQTFTCNKRVVPGDINGHSRGVIPHDKQIVSLQALPAGAPNGGSRSFFPPTVAKLLVGRYGSRCPRLCFPIVMRMCCFINFIVGHFVYVKREMIDRIDY